MAQPADVHIQAAVEGIKAPVQDQLGQVLPGQDLPRRLHQRAQQLKFHVGQVQLYAITGDGASAGIS